MVLLYKDMPGKTDDKNGSETISTINNSMSSPSVWKKVVKTIKNSNIDVDKLIKDSIEYGLDVGLFQQGKGGKIVSLETLHNNNTNNNSKVTLSDTNKNGKPIQLSNLKRKSDSESFNCSSSIKTRGSTNKSSPNLHISLKRSKTESHINSTSESDFMKERQPKLKCLRREMVRPVPICAYCLGDEVLNKRTNLQEDMISCWDCGTCAHPSCLRWPNSLLEKVRTIRWQCLQCKCCSYCGTVSRKDDDMLLCDSCDQGFHMYCFNPPMKALPTGEWICRLCRPLMHNKENITSFSMADFNFSPNCQIVTMENVKELCSPRRKVSNTISMRKSKVEKILENSRKKFVKTGTTMSLLHQKKKKLLEKAVQRQKSALTDGLTMFFTPGNKRTSRVSKQSLSSNSFTEITDQKSITSSPKEKSSVQSRTLNKSPVLSVKKRQRKAASLKLSAKYDTDSLTEHNQSTLSRSVKSTHRTVDSHSKDSSSVIRESPKKPTRKKTIAKDDLEIKPESVTESSSITMSRVDQNTSQSELSTENTEHTDQYPITDLDRQWYSEIQEKVTQLLPSPMDAPPHLVHSITKKSRQRTEHSDPPDLSAESVHGQDSLSEHPNACGDTVSIVNKRFPPRIQIGKYIVDTWYSAPYPSEYARLNVLYICEYCLKHIKSYDIYVIHMDKCTQHFPPGNEIYRNGDLSVFEVDGYVSKLYCQQLCLLAKLFLDHKTLYYDVEPFLFYVAVISKNQSCHIIGYFSKEKRSTHKYNLSCIMVLPPYQKYNYGRFLIDFSYLLSRNEGQSGSPEKPLSTLGRLSYESYWKSKIIPYLMNTADVSSDFYHHARFTKPPKGLSITIDKISTDTGINPHDVANTIQLLSKTVDLDDSDRITIQLDWEKIISESEKYSTRYSKWIPLDPDGLRWAPLMQPNERIQQFACQSVNVSPHISIASITQSDSGGKILETAPVKRIKTIKVQKPMQKRLTQSSESRSESKVSPAESIPSPIVSVDKLSKPHKKINNKKQIPNIENSPPKLKIFPKSIPKLGTRIIAKRCARVRRYINEKSSMTTRNHKELDNVSRKGTNTDIDILPKLSKCEILTSCSVENKVEVAEKKERIVRTNSRDLSPCVATNIKKRGRKVKQSVVQNICSMKPSWLVKPLPVSSHCLVPTIAGATKNTPISRSITIDIEPINVDLTCSDNSDNPDSDDCIVIGSAPISTRNTDWRKSKPVLEMFKETMKVTECLNVNTSKPSPPININEPSPVSTGYNSIPGPILASSEIDLEDDDLDADLILNDARQPLLILEKCDIVQSESCNIEEFDRSEDRDTSMVSFADLSSREINITVSESTSKTASPELVSVEELLKLSDEKMDDLSRLSSESHSLQLPAEISLNEEFRHFFNDGHVFNSITTRTTNTESSEKDADESLLSISNNSDFDLLVPYSCDSSLSSQPAKSDQSQPIPPQHHCSPGQSHFLHSQVSSTTTTTTTTTDNLHFIQLNAEWNSPIKHLETLCVLVDPLTPIVTLSHLDFVVQSKSEEEDDDGAQYKEGEVEVDDSEEDRSEVEMSRRKEYVMEVMGEEEEAERIDEVEREGTVREEGMKEDGGVNGREWKISKKDNEGSTMPTEEEGEESGRKSADQNIVSSSVDPVTTKLSLNEVVVSRVE